MAASIDGRILPDRWRPDGQPHSLYDRLHDGLEGDAWLVGRITGQEFAKRGPYPGSVAAAYPRRAWMAEGVAKTYGLALDPEGKIAWGRADIGGDPIVAVLTEAMSDAHLAGLRADGVSYIFAGQRQLDLQALVETLHDDLGVRRLIVEGGGVTNGAFLRAGLIDEVSLILWPTIDGAQGAPSVFDSPPDQSAQRAPIKGMQLFHCAPMQDGAVWLRYRVEAHPPSVDTEIA